MRSSSSPTTAPSVPVMSSASSKGISPVYTRLPSMSGGNREPSSSVKNPTARGRRVVMPARCTASTTCKPASTPRLPS